MDLGPNAIFVWASYGAAAVVLGALTCWLMLEGSRLQGQLEALEQRGVRRRGGAGGKSAPPPGNGSPA